MKPTISSYVLAALLAGLLPASVAFAAAPGGTALSMPKATAAQLVTMSAEVSKIDLQTRELTVKTDSGDMLSVKVPEGVSRLDAVKPGDRIDLRYYESVAIAVHQPGEHGSVAETEKTIERSTIGKLPGGLVAQQLSASAKVTRIDTTNDKLTIKTPDGHVDTIKVNDTFNQATLKRLKPGDAINVTYTEAVASSITPPTHQPSP